MDTTKTLEVGSRVIFMTNRVTELGTVERVWNRPTTDPYVTVKTDDGRTFVRCSSAVEVIWSSDTDRTGWTIAYRKPRANRFQRASDWSGTWQEATRMAAEFIARNPGMQVYYTSTRQAELSGKVCAEDIGNILTDTGRRVRIVETGSVL